ncbi:MAG: OmpH family outer membrane protein [Acetobacteraceae bacterium]
MLHTRLLTTIGLGLAFAATALAPASAQQQPQQQWFIPGQHNAPHPTPRPPVAAAPHPDEAPAVPVELKLPPAPAVPAVPRGMMPPATVVGVLSVPDVLRESTAYKQADKTLAARRQKLNEDAQKEQVALRTLGQRLAADRAKLTPAKIRDQEKALQDRIASSRREFAERNQIIQEQGQFAMAQIQRTLQEVVQKVAISRGMNLVLQRQAVAVNVPEFDLTQEVMQVMNKALPSVTIPPEGVAPLTLHAPDASGAPASKSGAAHKPAPTHKPASH